METIVPSSALINFAAPLAIKMPYEPVVMLSVPTQFFLSLSMPAYSSYHPNQLGFTFRAKTHQGFSSCVTLD